jgi:hypothetical protein
MVTRFVKALCADQDDSYPANTRVVRFLGVKLKLHYPRQQPITMPPYGAMTNDSSNRKQGMVDPHSAISSSAYDFGSLA